MAKRVAGWYWTNIATKRRRSLLARLMTLLLLILGTVLPILSSLGGDTELRLRLTQCGVAALAVAGLLQVADRIFGWSSGWLRYITTVTSIENLIREFELAWASHLIHKRASLDDSDTEKLFEAAKQLEESVLSLQVDETNKWVADFNAGAALLENMIKSQREKI